MSAQTNSSDCEPKYQRLVDEVIIGDLAGEKWERLRKHLQGCERCRARYNKLVLAERMLAGGPKAAGMPSPAELNRIARAVLPPERAPAWQRLLQWFTAPRAVAATGLVAVAAGLLIIPALRGMPDDWHKGTVKDPDTFQPRGGKGPVELFSKNLDGKPVERHAGLRAFCLTAERVQALDPKGVTPPRCDRAAQLKLAVSNPGGFRNVFLVGMDAEHDLKWYAPRPPETQSVSAPPGGESADVPVGASVRLAVNHRAGPVRIFALFSDKPISSTEVEAATADLAKQHVKAESAESLPLKRDDVLQRSLLIDIQP
jgi:hypothetical protein